jgi:hypothetical protein
MSLSQVRPGPISPRNASDQFVASRTPSSGSADFQKEEEFARANTRSHVQPEKITLSKSLAPKWKPKVSLGSRDDEFDFDGDNMDSLPANNEGVTEDFLLSHAKALSILFTKLGFHIMLMIEFLCLR